jgi:hypothetical protein
VTYIDQPFAPMTATSNKENKIESLNDIETEKPLLIGLQESIHTTMAKTIPEKDVSLVNKNVLKSIIRNGNTISGLRFDDNQHHQVSEGEEDADELSSTSSSNTDTGTDVEYATSVSPEYLTMKIMQLKCDLSAEKAMRRRKEKCIVKLAKRLQVCTQESDAKERQIYKMAKTINDLEDLLHNHHHELAMDQEKIRNVCRETEKHLEEYEDLVLSLRKQLFDSNVVIETLRLELQQQELSPKQRYRMKIDDSSSTSANISGKYQRFPDSHRGRLRAVLVGAGIATAVAVVSFSIFDNTTTSKVSWRH